MTELAQRSHGANDLEHAEQWWGLAAEPADPGAMYNVAVVSGIQRRFEDGKYWYQRATEGGDTNAMHNLAIRLRLGGREAEAAAGGKQRAVPRHSAMARSCEKTGRSTREPVPGTRSRCGTGPRFRDLGPGCGQALG